MAEVAAIDFGGTLSDVPSRRLQLHLVCNAQRGPRRDMRKLRTPKGAALVTGQPCQGDVGSRDSSPFSAPPLTVRFAAFHRPNSRVILINASDAQETCSHVSSLSFDTLSYLRRAGLIEGTSTESGADVFGPPHVVRKAIGRKANRLRWCRIILLRKCYVAAASVGLSFFLDGEPEISEHSYGASFSALEVTGTKPPARSELESYAQDCLRGVAAFVPDQLIRRRRGKTVLGEESIRAQPVVLLDRAQNVVTVYTLPKPRFHRTLRPFVMGIR